MILVKKFSYSQSKDHIWLYKAIKYRNAQKFWSYSCFLAETLSGVDSKLPPPGEEWVTAVGQWLVRKARDEAVSRLQPHLGLWSSSLVHYKLSASGCCQHPISHSRFLKQTPYI